ncbi:LysM peptidoglycan-binding domain-containing protein [Streptomyces sp. SID8379]|uniref:LysM peptidoglycan-binding domain-containing protein n=1 Tax=unclassified Streptomyces TaxID=2593676 RepID=UPI00037DDC3B|nr:MULTISPECIES: transglycosylase family protein [unclassified Streptomyces]MYW69150.1 LysM peptidoglycan-binding domain-containing protein [Streptomyces sp. SID8379]
MLSGNGRHRRPRQAPALVVAAGVTGSAIAIPLLAATNASAASTATWDKLAECESGAQWSLDAGNGYYGGLQFSQEMWERYGGLEYAPRADQASRSQQIAVAEKVLDDRGPTAWPSCSITAGLTKSDDSADVDPGATTSPQSSDTDSGEKNHDESGASDKSSGKSSDDSTSKVSGKSSDDSSDNSSDTESDETSDDASADDSADASADTSGNKAGDKGGATDDESAQSGATSSDSPEATPDATSDATSDPSASGRHRGDRATDDTADSRAGDGRHASRDDRRAADGYTVRAGDNLWDIADAQDVRGGWTELYDLNKKTVGADPDLILPGQSLDLGLESGEK